MFEVVCWDSNAIGTNTYPLFLFIMIRPPPRSDLFPYPTLFRSSRLARFTAGDIDVFRFSGAVGEIVTLRLQSAPGPYVTMYLYGPDGSFVGDGLSTRADVLHSPHTLA